MGEKMRGLGRKNRGKGHIDGHGRAPHQEMKATWMGNDPKRRKGATNKGRRLGGKIAGF